MKFLEYQELLLETSLEALKVPEDGAEQFILLHEIEYKLNKFMHANPYSYNPRLLRNVTKRYVDIYAEVYYRVSNIIEFAFETWLEEHPLNDEDKFADLIYSENKEIGNFRYGLGKIQRGSVSIDVNDHFNIFSTDELERLLYNELHDDDYIANSFVNEIVPKLMDNDIYPDEISDRDEAEDFWYSNPDMAYIEYQDRFGDYVPDRDDLLSMLDEIDISAIPEEYIKEIIKSEFIPIYTEQFFQLYQIIDDAEEALERLKKSNKNVEKAKDIADNLDKEMTQEEITEISRNISEATGAVSLCLNVMHTSGNIVGDNSSYKYSFIDTDFLDKLSNLDTTEWDKELDNIRRKKYKRNQE